MAKIILFNLFLFVRLACDAQHTDFDLIGKSFIIALNKNSDVTDEEKKVFLSDDLRSKTANFLKDMHTRYNNMEYHHTESKKSFENDGSFVLHIYAKSKNKLMYHDFQVVTETTSPYKINKIIFIAEVSEPINLPNGDIDSEYTLDWLRNYATNLKNKYDLNASVLITKGKKVLYEKYDGFQDVKKQIPINKNTKYSIASGGKMFTAVAILKLAEDNKLSLNDPITKYLIGFADKSKAEKTTIHHLLSHTSGVGEYWAGQRVESIEGANDIKPHVQEALSKPYHFEPGTDYQYCNSNFILLGAIIETVSKMSFYEYVQKSIFDKAGMTEVQYDSKLNSTRIADRWIRSPSNEREWSSLQSDWVGTSAGGAICTISDIAGFSDALRNGKLLSSSSFEKMIKVQNQPFGKGEDYGYGLILENRSGTFSYGHGGTAGGVNFEYRYYPEQDVTFIIMNNQNNGAYDDLKRNINKLISGDR